MSNNMSDSDGDAIFIREEHHVKVDMSKIDLTLLQDEDVNVTHISKTEMLAFHELPLCVSHGHSF